MKLEKQESRDMGGSRIFDWGGPRIAKVRDDGQNVALFALKSWPIVTPPETAHASKNSKPMVNFSFLTKVAI